jgi:hypothetical protein
LLCYYQIVRCNMKKKEKLYESIKQNFCRLKFVPSRIRWEWSYRFYTLSDKVSRIVPSMVMRCGISWERFSKAWIIFSIWRCASHHEMSKTELKDQDQAKRGISSRTRTRLSLACMINKCCGPWEGHVSRWYGSVPPSVNPPSSVA